VRQAALRREDGAVALLVAGALALGFVSAHLQHGFVPGAADAWPLAQVRVPVWHVIWMGAWTGYAMALVGQAAGIFALPYTTSVLQFSNVHVSPSTLVLTFLNPIGALLGFRRSGQWNPDFARWLCAGGVLGGLAGPFLRAGVLADAGAFRFALGIALAVVGAHLLHKALRGFAAPGAAPGQSANGAPARIETLAAAGVRLTIGYRGERWTVNQAALFAVGALAGVVSSALGLGGAFLIVPFLVFAYGLPLYVVPAATIPYAIVLSAVGLATYCMVLPLAGSRAVQPEWAWGFFAAAGGIFGSWAAAKTQLYIPEHFLDAMLGAVTGALGILYVLAFYVPLPFKV
jgi:uncharacterized membrane protein YfcA